ncbi:uncharacterized protein ACLA_035270 [Aspergillus clavatus NRRL 1]|uniref:Uncharacterized protein n=1 Tax=Aspergillus clavatus (strain ATCC 1007 / CBS 513.65 / DSM 816 / NCTC 3887 / NRRL 1 / QM 1276 / 107) TaxID=344612 RepID=A1CJK0_ASPCL|nr:uncharacterized protein ACLA_035270 [Aspergillus clavatus NRRL 1]EAW09324.1 conserved hypothetical protein [Aspergillus clavatus NRRL 1]
MADTYSFHPGDLNASYSCRTRAHPTTHLPAFSPAKKRSSPFYPDHCPEITQDASPDPFYLEQSLGESGTWGRSRRAIRDVRFCEEANQYFIPSSTDHNKKESTFSKPARGDAVRTRPNHLNRSTLSIVEFEHQQHVFPQVATAHWEKYPHHQTQGSVSSVQSDTTPDLTPSSSLSSNYSSPIYPDSGLQTSEYPQVSSSCRSSERSRPTWSTPGSGSRSALSTRPTTPARDIGFKDSTETLIMPRADEQDLQSRRGKPLPSLPINPRHGSGISSKRGTSSGRRPSIEPSMISPPCLINPVTLEPHTTHFDQAMFIPANECPSPVPSRGPPSPTAISNVLIPPTLSTKNRPSTSPSAVRGEQSVWESDSDSESLGPKSMSKKPMDTLKKVRSRVQLRVAKSAPKLQNSTSSQPSAPSLERFPTVPEPHLKGPFGEPVKAMIPTSSGHEVFRPSAQQTLRLVAPSTTSLVRPRTPGSRQNSGQHCQQRGEPRNHDFDRSAAAALQAKSRRKQRPDSPATLLSTEREKVCTFCREERSDLAIHHSLTLGRPPLYKRVWESLRLLGCHADITPPKSLPRKPI